MKTLISVGVILVVLIIVAVVVYRKRNVERFSTKKREKFDDDEEEHEHEHEHDMDDAEEKETDDAKKDDNDDDSSDSDSDSKSDSDSDSDDEETEAATTMTKAADTTVDAKAVAAELSTGWALDSGKGFQSTQTVSATDATTNSGSTWGLQPLAYSQDNVVQAATKEIPTTNQQVLMNRTDLLKRLDAAQTELEELRKYIRMM